MLCHKIFTGSEIIGIHEFIFFNYVCFLVKNLKIGKCLKLFGGIPQETRDKELKETFIVLDIGLSIHGYFPEWYIIWHTKRGALKVTMFYKI